MMTSTRGTKFLVSLDDVSYTPIILLVKTFFHEKDFVFVFLLEKVKFSLAVIRELNQQTFRLFSLTFL